MNVSKEHRIAILKYYIEYAYDPCIYKGLCANLSNIADKLFGYDYYKFEVAEVFPLFKSVCKQFGADIREGFYWPSEDLDSRIAVCKKLLEIEENE